MEEWPPYFAIRRERSGRIRYYWKASRGLRTKLPNSRHASYVRLSDDPAIAVQECVAITRKVLSWIAAHPDPLLDEAKPMPPPWAPPAGPPAATVRRRAPEQPAALGIAAGVYVVGFRHGPVKIGHGRDPRRRIGELQTGSAKEIHLFCFLRVPGVDGVHIEFAAHRALSAHRQKGEWFAIRPRAAIKTVLDIVSAKIGGGEGA